MRGSRTRDAWFFVRPAGYMSLGDRGHWRCSEGWTVWIVEERSDAYYVRARMWGGGPRYDAPPERHASLHAAREAACSRVFVLSGCMSVEGLARRCPRARYVRGGSTRDHWLDLPWRWLHEP